MTLAPPEPFPVDLYSASSFADGHPSAQYAWLRDNDPVHRHVAPDGGHFWAVTRHADIKYVERHPALFCSSPTVLLVDLGVGNGFYSMDAPAHPIFRRLVAPKLTPREVRFRMPSLQALATEIVDGVVERGACDLVEDVAALMAAYTAADLLGMPRSDGRHMHDLLMIMHSTPDVVGEDTMIATMMELIAMGQAVFRDRRANPRDDVYSLYANMEVDGVPMTEEVFLGHYMLLTDGSLDTTRNLIAGGMLLLFRNPDQRAMLEADLDGRLPGAIEEMVRLVSPVAYIVRRATEDTELAGQVIREGDRVAIYFGAGNRDPEVFADPEAFDITRNNHDQIAFGNAGPHFCVGAHLGRAEASAMLRELLTRLPDIEQAGPPEWAATSLTSGLASLPARFTPAR
jgi:cytochrome P450